MTNKELKKKIYEYRTITMSIYSNEPPMLLHCLTDEELMDLIKEVVESVIPPKMEEAGNTREERRGHDYAVYEMKDNLEKLLKE